MSLDVTLTDGSGWTVYDANITHNLIGMAEAAGIYECLWRPEEHGYKYASQIIEPLAAGLAKMVTQKGHFEHFNAENGWGKWENFVPWCAAYLQACRDNPDATVSVSR